MAGNKIGGLKAAKTNKKLHGKNYYKELGKLGGSVSHPSTRYFAMNPELARIAGEKGGKASRRGKAKK